MLWKRSQQKSQITCPVRPIQDPKLLQTGLLDADPSHVSAAPGEHDLSTSHAVSKHSVSHTIAVPWLGKNCWEKRAWNCKSWDNQTFYFSSQTSIKHLWEKNFTEIKPQYICFFCAIMPASVENWRQISYFKQKSVIANVWAVYHHLNCKARIRITDCILTNKDLL